MSSPKKYGKHKTRNQVFKKKTTYIALAVALFLILLFIYTVLKQAPIDTTPKAAIIDHLSIQWPNTNFTETAETILNEAGLPVDYYPGEEVTVDLYRQLAHHNYKIIIFRVHSTGECSVEGQPPFVVFFSSEKYSNTNHVPDQLAMRVVYVNFPEPQPPGFFGITPLFIKDSVERKFNDTIIIAMGCDGLMHNTMAEAFIEKGAKAYIGWNGPVTIDHTDSTIVHLIRYLVTEKQTIQESVSNTMKEVGPDPVNQSILIFYPGEASSYIIPNFANNTACHAGETQINALNLILIQLFLTVRRHDNKK